MTCIPASLINLVCAIYGFKFQTMPVFILVNDNQTKLLFLQPQIRNYLAFLFLHLVHYSFILHFSSRWLDIFLISEKENIELLFCINIRMMKLREKQGTAIPRIMILFKNNVIRMLALNANMKWDYDQY